MVKRLQTKKLMFSKTAMMLLFVLLTSATAWAEKGDVVATGTCGDNLTWMLTENGEADITYNSGTYTPLTLTITGTGAMTDYTGSGKTPWWSNHIAITHLELPEGLTHVGNHAFALNYFIQSVTLPASVTSIGEQAFSSVGSNTSKRCMFTAAKGSKLTSIATEAFMNFGGYVDLRNCTSLTTIGEKVFEDYKKTVYLPISIRTIEKDAFYSVSTTNKPTVWVSYENSVLYVNGAFNAFSTTEKTTAITSFLHLKVKSSDAVSICQIFPDEIKLTFDETDHSFVIANEQGLIDFAKMYKNEDYEDIRQNLNGKLVADLDFTNMPLNCNDDANIGNGNFLPIGTYDGYHYIAFKATFDGQGHTITGLKYSGGDNLGLFCTIGQYSTVKNVTLINPIFSGKSYIGGIVGHNFGTISDCTVLKPSISGTDLIGCIAGYDEYEKVTNCYYDVSTGLNIVGNVSAIYTYNSCHPLYRLNLGSGVTSDALTYGDYTVATQGSIIKLEASREGYEFGGFNSDDVTIENGLFTMPDKNVSVTAVWEPLNEISLKASKIDGLYWSTFYCGDAGYRIADGEEACAYTATVSDDKIVLHMLGRVIPKGTAVIIVGVGEDNSISMTRDDASAAEYSAVNDLKGVDLPTARTSLTSNDSYRLYMLSNKNDHFGFHSFAAANVPARKAFFTVPASANARPFSMVFDEETTAIRQLRKTVAESPVYDLNGRVVRGNNLKPGVYVKNGKKVVVK